jgi:glycosyltransferase involved in cell wall biosynthesis
MTAPQVSVVIPTHNRSTLLALTLRSVLWQEDVSLEAIVVDDGSIVGALQTVAGLDDPRIRVIRNESAQGVSSARNRGIDESRGDWIAFLDDDDLWAPRKLAAQLRAAAASHDTWAYAGVVKIDGRNKMIGGTPPPPPREVIEALPRRNSVPGGCSGVIVTREALASAGGFDPALVNLADWDMWVRLGTRGPPACAPDPLVAYRHHVRQASLDVDLILREADLMDGRYGARIDRGMLHHYLAHRCLLAGRRCEAIQHWVHAALDGQTGPVVADVSAMLRARVRRHLPMTHRSDPHAAWRSSAVDWLSTFQDHTGS